MSCTIRARYNSAEVLTCGELKWPDVSETHFAKYGVRTEEVEEVLAGSLLACERVVTARSWHILRPLPDGSARISVMLG